MLSLLTYAKKYRKQIIFGPIFKFIEAVLELFLPLLLARMIDEGLKKNDPAMMWKMVLYMALISIVGLLSAIICQYFASVASQGFGTELRNALMAKIHTFSYPQLDKFGPETLITRLTNDITQVQTALAMFIRLFVRAPFLSIGSILMAFYLNWQMGLIFLLVLPFFILLLVLIIKFSVPLYATVQKKLDTFSNLLSQNLTGVRVIRAFGKKKEMTEKTKNTSNSLAFSYEKVAQLSALLAPLTSFILNLGILGILYFGGKLVWDGTLPQGEILALINYMTQMLLSLIIVSNLVVLFTRAEASGTRVYEVLASENPLVKGCETLSADDVKKETILAFDQVSFRYTKKSGLVLNQLNFQVKKNTTLGIIGATGSGKSSLLPLILHEYEATKGCVYFFEKNILDLSKEDLLSHIAYVPQKAALFTGTIRENLAFGKDNPTDEACFTALKIAQMADFVAQLPEGLESRVVEGGKNFSGGQRQRLTIARALMKKPQLLLLDDALSALDYETDLALRTALKKELQQTTTILISQRVSSIKDAEKILVLKNGQQVGLGTHEELLTSSPAYEEIYNSQQEVAQ